MGRTRARPGVLRDGRRALAGHLALSPDEIIADGERVVVLTRVHAQRNGRSETFTNAHVMRVVDGQITELREYMGDERREDEFWGS